MSKKDIAGIHVDGRKWFDDVNGNTYHTVKVSVFYEDGETDVLESEDIVYGYGDQYIVTAHDLLEEEGVLRDQHSAMGRDPLSKRCRRYQIGYERSVVDVKERDNLHDFE